MSYQVVFDPKEKEYFMRADPFRPVIQQIGYPDFIEIVTKCKEKMSETYNKYGNSWMDFNGLKFWKSRLDGEIEEIYQAKTFEEFQKEIIDAINVLSMMYQKPDDWLFSEKFRQSLQNTKVTEGSLQ